MKGDVRLLNSKSKYSRCSLPRLVVEGAEGLGGIDKKADDWEPNVNEREIEPLPVRSDTINGQSLRKNRNLAKTNGQKYGASDIRSHFGDRGVT